MLKLDLNTAVSEIKQACEGVTDRRQPYFFIVGAGVSCPPVGLAADIQQHCMEIAQSYGRIEQPATTDPIDTYSNWFSSAYPQPIERQQYLKSLVKDRPISLANLRLAHLLLKPTIGSTVVTTNFDDFLSQALTLFGRPHITCDSPKTVERIDPERTDEVQIVHVHGTYWFYDCCNLRGEVADRAQPSPQTTTTMAALLDTILWRRMPLVIGYSGWEGDVVMAALKRRLQSNLPYRLYWFCYRNESLDSLPVWLKSAENVCFVVPPSQQPAATDPTVQSGSLDRSTEPAAPVETDIEDPSLSARMVLDRLIQAFELDAPELTSDPLAFFLNRLSQSLSPQLEDMQEGDIYSINSVIEDLRTAHEEELKRKKNIEAAEAELERVRDALRRSQYREAVDRCAAMVASTNPSGMPVYLMNVPTQQLVMLIEIIASVAALVGIDPKNQLDASDFVLTAAEVLKGRGTNETQINHIVARAKLTRANALARQGRTQDALTNRDDAL